MKPPQPRENARLPERDSDGFVLTLAGAPTPRDAVEGLLDLVEIPGSGAVFVIPSMAVRPASGAHPQVVAGLLGRLGPRATLGIAAGTPAPIRRRWEQLATEAGTRALTLGRAGWDRIELPGEEFMLDEVFLPAEVIDAEARIAVPAIADEALALGFVRGIVHPHTRLRARGNVNRARLDAEIAATLKASYLLDASRLHGDMPTNLCVWANDAVSAELAGVGIKRYIDAARGFESAGAWEHPRVQAASELGIGPSSGSDMLLRSARSDAGVRRVAGFLSDELSCDIQWLNGED